MALVKTRLSSGSEQDHSYVHLPGKIISVAADIKELNVIVFVHDSVEVRAGFYATHCAVDYVRVPEYVKYRQYLQSCLRVRMDVIVLNYKAFKESSPKYLAVVTVRGDQLFTPDNKPFVMPVVSNSTQIFPTVNRKLDGKSFEGIVVSLSSTLVNGIASFEAFGAKIETYFVLRKVVCGKKVVRFTDYSKFDFVRMRITLAITKTTPKKDIKYEADGIINVSPSKNEPVSVVKSLPVKKQEVVSVEGTNPQRKGDTEDVSSVALPPDLKFSGTVIDLVWNPARKCHQPRLVCIATSKAKHLVFIPMKSVKLEVDTTSSVNMLPEGTCWTGMSVLVSNLRPYCDRGKDGAAFKGKVHLMRLPEVTRGPGTAQSQGRTLKVKPDVNGKRLKGESYSCTPVNDDVHDADDTENEKSSCDSNTSDVKMNDANFEKYLLGSNLYALSDASLSRASVSDASSLSFSSDVYEDLDPLVVIDDEEAGYGGDTTVGARRCGSITDYEEYPPLSGRDRHRMVDGHIPITSTGLRSCITESADIHNGEFPVQQSKLSFLSPDLIQVWKNQADEESYLGNECRPIVTPFDAEEFIRNYSVSNNNEYHDYAANEGFGFCQPSVSYLVDDNPFSEFYGETSNWKAGNCSPITTAPIVKPKLCDQVSAVCKSGAVGFTDAQEKATTTCEKKPDTGFTARDEVKVVLTCAADSAVTSSKVTVESHTNTDKKIVKASKVKDVHCAQRVDASSQKRLNENIAQVSHHEKVPNVVEISGELSNLSSVKLLREFPIKTQRRVPACFREQVRQRKSVCIEADNDVDLTKNPTDEPESAVSEDLESVNIPGYICRITETYNVVALNLTGKIVVAEFYEGNFTYNGEALKAKVQIGRLIKLGMHVTVLSLYAQQYTEFSYLAVVDLKDADILDYCLALKSCCLEDKTFTKAQKKAVLKKTRDIIAKFEPLCVGHQKQEFVCEQQKALVEMQLRDMVLKCNGISQSNGKPENFPPLPISKGTEAPCPSIEVPPTPRPKPGTRTDLEHSEPVSVQDKGSIVKKGESLGDKKNNVLPKRNGKAQRQLSEEKNKNTEMHQQILDSALAQCLTVTEDSVLSTSTTSPNIASKDYRLDNLVSITAARDCEQAASRKNVEESKREKVGDAAGSLTYQQLMSWAEGKDDICTQNAAIRFDHCYENSSTINEVGDFVTNNSSSAEVAPKLQKTSTTKYVKEDSSKQSPAVQHSFNSERLMHSNEVLNPIPRNASTVESALTTNAISTDIEAEKALARQPAEIAAAADSKLAQYNENSGEETGKKSPGYNQIPPHECEQRLAKRTPLAKPDSMFQRASPTNESTKEIPHYEKTFEAATSSPVTSSPTVELDFKVKKQVKVGVASSLEPATSSPVTSSPTVELDFKVKKQAGVGVVSGAGDSSSVSPPEKDDSECCSARHQFLSDRITLLSDLLGESTDHAMRLTRDNTCLIGEKAHLLSDVAALNAYIATLASTNMALNETIATFTTENAWLHGHVASLTAQMDNVRGEFDVLNKGIRRDLGRVVRSTVGTPEEDDEGCDVTSVQSVERDAVITAVPTEPTKSASSFGVGQQMPPRTSKSENGSQTHITGAHRSRTFCETESD